MIYLFEASLYWMAKRIGGSFPSGFKTSRSWLKDLSRNLPKRKERRMSKPHPSMALTLDLDESIVDHELRLEIDRCYSYLGTPVVRTHPRPTASR